MIRIIAFLIGLMITSASAQTGQLGAGQIWGNPNSSTGLSVPTSVGAVIDQFYTCSAQGSILYRASSAWFCLAPGTSGTFLKTSGASSNPAWSAVQSATNSVLGVMKGDGTTISCTAGTCVGIGATATTIAPGTTTISPTINGDVLYDNSGVLGEKTPAALFAAGPGISLSGTNTINALSQSIPGGRLTLQMSAGIGGVPTIDTPAIATKVIVLLPGTTTWTVPLDFTAVNTLVTLGGVGGSGGSTGAVPGGSSGGAAYSAISNQTFTPGATVTVNVPIGGTAGAASAGDGGAATDTWLCNTLVTNCASIAGSAVIVGAKSGAQGLHTGAVALGGSSASGIGSTKFSGGNSAAGGSTGVGGAGGAAGPSGNGGNGVSGSGTTAGAGGTADGGVVAGGAIASAGISAAINTDTITERIANLLSGAGGSNSSTASPACAGGYGAGNSSGYGGGVGGGSNGAGGQIGCPGVIVITYTPSPTVMTYSPCGTYVAGCGSPYVPYYNGTNMALGAFTSGLNDAVGLTLILTVTDNIAGDCYEVFYFNNSGTPTIGTGPALASCTPGSLSRAATGGLATVGSILANTTASMTIKNNGSSFTCPQYQCTVLGMIHVPVNGQVPVQISPNAVANGPNSEVGLDNYYNKIVRRIKAQDSTASWTYNLTSPRAANNQVTNAISVLDGLGVKQLQYGYYTSFTGSGAFAGTNQMAVNQTCATGITHGAGFGAFMTQTAGTSSGQGGPGITFDAPYPVAGLNKVTACDGAVNASITVFGNDFMQYFVEEAF